MQIIDMTGYSIRSAMITMRRKDTPLKFVIFPMVHVATPDFYATVRVRLEECDLIVAEGVRGKSLQIRALLLAYRLVPRRSRGALQEQDYATLLPPGVPVVNPDVTAAEVAADLRRAARWFYPILLVLAPLWGLVFALRGPEAFLTEDIVVEDQPPGPRAAELDDDPLNHALLDRRDRLLLDALGRIHTERSRQPITVAVIYGASHVPAMTHGLLDAYGYVPMASEWLTVYEHDC